jgi:signal transduction histidine kinase
VGGYFPATQQRRGVSLVLSRAVPIRDASGKVVRWFGTNTDITEQRNIEDALRQSKEFNETQVRERTRELELRNAEVLQQSEQLRDLSSRLLQTQDEERRRIARELHHSAGQVLAALGMNLSSLAQHARKNAPHLVKGAEDGLNITLSVAEEFGRLPGEMELVMFRLVQECLTNIHPLREYNCCDSYYPGS